MNRRLKELEILESRVARLENTINNRKDELFGGLIGKVNATAKEWKEFGNVLKKAYGEWEADIVVETHGVAMITSFEDEEYTVIFDEGKKGSEKIRVTLFRGKERINQVTGFRMEPSKLKNAMRDLFKKAGVDTAKLKRPKSSTNPIVSKWDNESDKVNKRDEFEREWSKFLVGLGTVKSKRYVNSVKDKHDEFLQAYLKKDKDPESYFNSKPLSSWGND